MTKQQIVLLTLSWWAVSVGCVGGLIRYWLQAPSLLNPPDREPKLFRDSLQSESQSPVQLTFLL